MRVDVLYCLFVRRWESSCRSKIAVLWSMHLSPPRTPENLEAGKGMDKPKVSVLGGTQ